MRLECVDLRPDQGCVDQFVDALSGGAQDRLGPGFDAVFRFRGRAESCALRPASGRPTRHSVLYFCTPASTAEDLRDRLVVSKRRSFVVLLAPRPGTPDAERYYCRMDPALADLCARLGLTALSADQFDAGQCLAALVRVRAVKDGDRAGHDSEELLADAAVYGE